MGGKAQGLVGGLRDMTAQQMAKQAASGKEFIPLGDPSYQYDPGPEPTATRAPAAAAPVEKEEAVSLPAAKEPVETAASPIASGTISPVPTGQAVGGSMATTQDTGGMLAGTVAPPAMWADKLKSPGGIGKLNGQV